ncbi:MAG: DUF5686 and carboxypeptidase regulatory-like domain-containing protein [Bacteroidetes bacterium]|nr:DUF5686 and carboxypeptidase regulatory-like domain-containing protein [Bacteroidota bacterium]
MRQFYIIFLLLLSFFLSPGNNSLAQITKVRGSVFDSETNEPVPFANITFKNSSIGTITNMDGEYFLETRENYDSLVVSFVGYKPQTKRLNKYNYQELNFKLEPNVYALEEIVVLPTENPAHPILRNIIANKKKHNPTKFDYFSYQLYNKIELDVNNVDEEFKQNRLFRDFQFIFDYVDTSTVTGKPYLPIFITETISDYYYTKNPDKEREVITASKISGFENASLSQFTGKMYQDINIYENYVSVFEPGFVSPIADFGLLFYKYYLIDSAYIGNKWCYQISFVPKRTQERTFRGDFWVNDTSFAIVKIQMRMAKEVNINYINDFVAEYEYTPVDDSLWFLKNEKMFFDFNISDKSTGFFGRKTTAYSNINLRTPPPADILDLKEDVIVDEDAIKTDMEFWDKNRPMELTPKEKNIYSMVDSIQQVPVYTTIEKIVSMLVMYHYEIGLFQIGPYYKLYSFNEIEGNRFRFGGETSRNFSTDIQINAHVAYGDLDNRFKYGLGYIYLFDKNPRVSLEMQYKHDIQQLGQSPNALTEDNFFTSILRRNPNYKLTMVDDFSTTFEKEWFQGLITKFTYNYRNIESTQYIPFQKATSTDTLNFNSITTSEVTLNARYAKNEKFVRGSFNRLSLGTHSPVFTLNLTAGLKDIFSSEYEYYTINLSIEDKVPMGLFGYTRFIVDGGKLFGEVPYPLLKLHEGNETYALDKYAFNMMNYYEFASDEYVGLFVEHHFQGLFLNKIPLMRKLKWREVVSAKGVIGNLSDKHQSIMDFPDGLYELNDPYAEASIGIENILKLIRIDAMWRLTHLQHDNIQKFGLRVGVQVVF